MYNLKVKTSSGATIPFQGQVNGESNLYDLHQALFTVTSIPVHRQKILIGFPRKQVVGNNEDKLKSLGIKNGEVIIVEEIASSILESTNISASPRHVMDPVEYTMPERFPRGSLIKKEVPSDNSCLFTSIYFLVNGGDVIENDLKSMREIVAQAVAQEPQKYDEALLEKSNEDYCRWILKDTSWGGAIELAVFSDYYETEIVALDAKTGTVNRFGEDKKYDQRIFVMYDGIHYDPLYLLTNDKSRELYIFPSSEEWLLHQAYEMVQSEKNSGRYTDTNKFRLICKDCGVYMFGDQEALKHAKDTSHSKFEEVKDM